jgi:hypothetical protein
MRRSLRALWTCPACGHRFVGRNMWHSCVNVPIAAHFKGKPELRRVFDKYAALARKCARTRIAVCAQKSRIVFQARARYAGCIVKKDHLEGAIWLKYRLRHPRFHRCLDLPPNNHVHYFRLRTVKDVDAHLGTLLRKAYKTGMQEHLPRLQRARRVNVRKPKTSSPKKRSRQQSVRTRSAM